MPLQWRVIRAALDPSFGREQAGERPVIVISAEPLNEQYEVVMVLPVTSRKRDRAIRLGEVLIPAGTAGLPHDSIALCYQARAIDKQRLLTSYGEIPEGSLRKDISDTLLDCLDLPRS